MDLKRKVPLGVRLKSTKRSHTKGFAHTSVRVLELKKLRRGCGGGGAPDLNGPLPGFKD